MVAAVPEASERTRTRENSGRSGRLKEGSPRETVRVGELDDMVRQLERQRGAAKASRGWGTDPLVGPPGCRRGAKREMRSHHVRRSGWRHCVPQLVEEEADLPFATGQPNLRRFGIVLGKPQLRQGRGNMARSHAGIGRRKYRLPPTTRRSSHIWQLASWSRFVVGACRLARPHRQP